MYKTRYWYGTTDGSDDYYDNTMNGKSFCSQMSWVDGAYSAICAGPLWGPWYEGSCPKGWGRNKYKHPDDTYTVQNAQGYVNDNSTPIYNTVTKYRDTVYNYTAGRIAKA